jgi:ABC-type sugar transport system ATPase subunit
VSLQFERIQKTFGAVNALRGVSFDVAEGEAHALVGENGAGKSTLLKILAGLVRADAGQISWQGRPFAPAGPREAIEYGIGMVYQEMLCLPNLSVSANIFCGREIARFGRLDETAMRSRTQAVLDRLALRIDPDDAAESLSAAHRQLLQVARALTFDCRILVLDEPTTALTDFSRAARQSSMSRIACPRCFGSAIASRYCAMARTSAPIGGVRSHQPTSSEPWLDGTSRRGPRLEALDRIAVKRRSRSRT